MSKNEMALLTFKCIVRAAKYGLTPDKIAQEVVAFQGWRIKQIENRRFQ